MNINFFIQRKITFLEATRVNKRMKPIDMPNISALTIKEALIFQSEIKDAALLKKLLNDPVWSIAYL